MRSPLDDIVVTEGNKEAFEKVIGITKEQDGPVRLFIYGPSGSGKSAVLRARGVERDLLSSRTVLFTHAPEVISAIRLESSEKLLNNVVEVDALIIDSFDAFFDDDEIGPDVCRLLMTERNRKNLDTIIAARGPLTDYDTSRLGGVFDGFDQIAVEALDAQGRIEFAKKMYDRFSEDIENPVVISDAALNFVANEFADGVGDINPAVRFLVTAAGFDEGAEISEEQARQAFSR